MKGRTLLAIVALSGALMFSLVAVTFAVGETMLRWTIDWPNIVDPAYSNQFSDMQTAVNLYSPLVYPLPDGNVEPHAAKSWDVSEDGLTWTFEIRPGVSFSDGTELEAEDVKFSMDRFLTIGAGFSYLFKRSVESVEVLDKYIVQFHMRKPYATFLSALIKFYVLNKDQVMENAVSTGPYGEFGDYGEEWLVTHSAGSGAYMVKTFVVTDYLLMEKNPYYSFYISPKAADQVKMIGNIEAMTVQTLMRNREVEISDFWQSNESFTVLDAIPNVDLISFPAAKAAWIMLHTQKPPTDDVHFRKALCWAFDYEVAARIFQAAVAKGPLPHLLAGWDPDTFQYYRDVDKAREELAKSKYADELDEYPLSYAVWTPNDNIKRLALLFQANMAELGITVNLEMMPVPRYLDIIQSKETNPNCIEFEVAAEYPEAGSMLSIHLHSANVGRYEHTHWLEDPDIDQLVEEALSTLDKEKRFKLYSELQNEAMELALDVVVYDAIQRQAVQSYVTWPQAENPRPAMGYNMDARFIEVDWEKRAELLGQ